MPRRFTPRWEGNCEPPHTRADGGVRGVMLLGLLIGLALGSIALMAMVDDWVLQRQRQREEQLLFVGDAYRQAIQRYYYGAPAGQPRQLPENLQSLLADERYPTPTHPLRRLYPDPMTGTMDWGELRINDRLAGVYSKSESPPIKQAGFAPAYDSFKGREHYYDWVFAFAIAPGTSALLPPVAPGTPSRNSPRFRK